MAKPVREDEWMAELMRLSIRADAGRTSQEWAEVLGVSWKTALLYLNKAKKLGRLKKGYRTAERLDGKPFPVVVYSVVPAPNKRAGR